MFLNICLQRGATRYSEKLAVLTYVTKNGFLYFWLPKILFMRKLDETHMHTTERSAKMPMV